MAYEAFGQHEWPDGSGSLFETELNPQGRLIGVRMTVPVGHAARIIIRRAGNTLIDQRWPDVGMAQEPIVQEWRVPGGQVAANVEWTCEMA